MSQVVIIYMALRQIGLMSPNIEISNLSCLISFVMSNRLMSNIEIKQP